MRRRLLAAVVMAALAAACGEPPVAVEMPPRSEGQQVADLAGVLDESQRQDLQDRLEALAAAGDDIVTLTYETDDATCGEAYRAANQFVRAWDADIALVAVARPGDFQATGEQRQRCVGVQPAEERAVDGDLRERIAEEIVPAHTGDNDWHGAFVAAVEALAQR